MFEIFKASYLRTCHGFYVWEIKKGLFVNKKIILVVGDELSCFNFFLSLFLYFSITTCNFLYFYVCGYTLTILKKNG